MNNADSTSPRTQETERIAWNKSVSHPLQSWEWGQFRKAMGIDVVRLKSWQITFHRIPHTPWVIGYFPKGPVITGDMLASLRKLGREKHAVFIQIEPDREAGSFHLPDGAADVRRSHHPLFTNHTFILDLTKPESELLAAMHSKTRYNLRVAQKHHVMVTEDNSNEAFAAYLSLNDETTSRQGFYAHNNIYHQTMWKIMRDSGIAHLFTAVYQGKILAAWVIFCWNKTIYYPYGTSSRDNREVMAPTLMLWEIARWGAANGYERFDLWGALGATPDPKDPWFGFHRFKQGFNPRHIEFAGSFDLVIHPLLYHLYTIGDTIRWFFLKKKT